MRTKEKTSVMEQMINLYDFIIPFTVYYDTYTFDIALHLKMER